MSVCLRALCFCACVCLCVFRSGITRELLSTAPLDASLALLKEQSAHVQHNGGIKRLLADCPASALELPIEALIKAIGVQARVADLWDLPQSMQHQVPFWSGACVSNDESEESLVMPESICNGCLWK